MKTFEIWRAALAECPVTVLCRDDPDYERKKVEHLYAERGAALEHTFQAEDWVEALARRNELLRLRPYDPHFIPGDEP